MNPVGPNTTVNACLCRYAVNCWVFENDNVWSRPALYVQSLKTTYIVIFYYTNKTDLTLT